MSEKADFEKRAVEALLGYHDAFARVTSTCGMMRFVESLTSDIVRSDARSNLAEPGQNAFFPIGPGNRLGLPFLLRASINLTLRPCNSRTAP